MAEHTIQEAGLQARKAGAYFSRVLEAHGRTVIAVEIDGTVIVVARGISAPPLKEAIGGLFGDSFKVEQAPPPLPAEKAASVLIGLYHEPSGDYAHKAAHVHLHLLEDGVDLGRRKRVAGECLCTKKRGSKERMPAEGETTVCPECVQIAEKAGLVWSLA